MLPFNFCCEQCLKGVYLSSQQRQQFFARGGRQGNQPSTYESSDSFPPRNSSPHQAFQRILSLQLIPVMHHACLSPTLPSFSEAPEHHVRRPSTLQWRADLTRASAEGSCIRTSCIARKRTEEASALSSLGGWSLLCSALISWGGLKLQPWSQADRP